MASTLSIADLRNMTLKELQGEIARQQGLVRKMRMGITLGREKNSAGYRREKRQLARMSTVETGKRKEELSGKPKTRTLPPPAGKTKAPAGSSKVVKKTRTPKS